MGDRFEHPSDLTVAAFMDGNRYDGLFIIRVHILIFHFGRRRHSVLQHDPLAKLVQLGAMGHPFHGSQVCFGHMIFRVAKQIGKLAVIGQRRSPSVS